MNMENVQMILAVIGGVLLGLPVLLRALHAICVVIPGEQPDKAVEKILAISEKIADVVNKIFPQAPKK